MNATVGVLDALWPVAYGVVIGISSRLVAEELIARGHPRRLVNSAVLVAAVLLILTSWTVHAILSSL